MNSDGRETTGFFAFLRRHLDLVAVLTKKEFQTRYLGSYLGVIWVILQPIVTVFIFWFVFAIGFRTRPAGGDFPYILWMIAGLVPWFFLNDGITTGAGAILDNSYMVKKVAFRVSLLPLVRVLAALAAGLILLGLLLVVFFLCGRPIGVHSLQIVYFLAAGLVLGTGVSLITSTLTVFIRDIRPMVAIFMQFAFWMTAVFWPIDILPARYRFLIRLNPFSYIVEGFRDSLIHRLWFWNAHLLQTAYFWSLTLIVLGLGITIYRKLRPSFADHL